MFVRLFASPMDGSPPGSSVHGILQARTWSGLTCPPPGHLPDSGIVPGSPALQADYLPSEPPGKPILHFTHTQLKSTSEVKQETWALLHPGFASGLCSFSLSSLPPSLFIPLCVGDTGEDPFQGFSVKGSLQGSLSQVHSLPWEKVSPAVWLLLTAAGGGARRSE